MGLSQIVDHPGRENINSGLSPSDRRLLTALYGSPRADYTDSCQPPTSDRLRDHVATASVGPFRVTGIDVAIASLRRVFKEVEEHDPELVAVLGTAGMLCCRLVRGAHQTPSIHSWGAAIDVTIAGQLQPLGSDGVQAGMLRLYKFMRAEGWFWGAGFSRNDPMHWELSPEALNRLLKKG